MSAPTSSAAIDFSKPFIPETLTPLYYTPVYRQLSGAQRLRYNQLHACYFNEQVIFFESSMARHILGYFLSRRLPDRLAEGLRVFIEEEARHSEMFRNLNRQCLPRYYLACDFHFIHVPPLSSRLLRFWVRHPRWFPFFIWLMLIQEERALFYAREFLKASAGLEPHFVAVQKAHLADEVGHIRWDEVLLDQVWPRFGPLLRRMNARLFAWMVEEYFNTPRRGGVRVLDELAAEFPELRSQLAEMHSQMRRLSGHREFQEALYSRAITPKAFGRFDACAEFHGLGKVLPGYTPAPVPQT